MSRLSLSNISPDLIKRLNYESEYQDSTNNEIISDALTMYFKQTDADRLIEDPPDPIDIDLDTPENKRILDQYKLQKEDKEKELEISEGNIREIKKEFDGHRFELREFARKLNDGYSVGDVYKIYNISLIDLLCQNYNFEIIKVEVLSEIPMKKVRYLKKKITN